MAPTLVSFIGQHVVGQRVPIHPGSFLDPTTISKVGAVYEIEVYTDRLVSPDKWQELVDNITMAFEAKTAHVTYMQQEMSKDGPCVAIQLRGSPFYWVDLLGLLGPLFTIASILIIAIGVFSVVMNIPTWAWGLLITGSLLLLLAPTIAKSAKGGAKTYMKMQEKRLPSRATYTHGEESREWA